ncbi:hypothetical protein P5704_023780 (plasmid) [Pseudomonas sp. FeN3W]|nr:hypothetical protein P5704_023780 [Pseudomonas sp. FeN3W]
MRQYSFIIPVQASNTARVIEVLSHPFVRPESLLSVVNQSGKVKLHAIVDDSKPAVMHNLLLVGTGNHIPDEAVSTLHKVGSFLVGDNQYGYHLYYIGEDVEAEREGDRKVAFRLRVEVIDDSSIEDVEEAREELIDALSHFEAQHFNSTRLDDSERNVWRFDFFEEAFRTSAAYAQLMLTVCSSAAVAKFDVEGVSGDAA